MKLFLSFPICFILWGCVGGSGLRVDAYGAARWPEIKRPEKLTYTDKEKEALDGFSKENPELAGKIATQLKVMRISLNTYDKLRWKHNAEGLRTLGYSEREIVDFLGPDPNAEADKP